MVGITLSPEQVRDAPPEVRRWLEQQVADALGLHRPPPPVAPGAHHLVACDVEQAKSILSMIQPWLPVVSVFFELAREPGMTTAQGLRVLQVTDIMRHCRLHQANQVLACLDAINQALQNLSGDPDAALTMVDQAGHCLVADATARSILNVWQDILSAREAVRPTEPAASPNPQAPVRPAFQSPYAIPVPVGDVRASGPDL